MTGYSLGDFETSAYRKETNFVIVFRFASNRPACHKRICIKAHFGVSAVMRLVGKRKYAWIGSCTIMITH